MNEKIYSKTGIEAQDHTPDHTHDRTYDRDRAAAAALIRSLGDGLTRGSVRGCPEATDDSNHPTSAPGLSIGDILVGSGRLSPHDAERVAQHQRQDNLPFGEVALSMRLITRADVNYALNKQFDYDCLDSENVQVSPEVVAAFEPFSRVGENLRAVRSQLMLRWLHRDAQAKVLAIVSPARRDGRSFMAANLAVVFAQQGERTLLIDGNLRQPRQAELFQQNRRSPGLSHLLASRAGMEVIGNVPGLPKLSVLSAGAPPPNPQELLGRPAFRQLLATASHNFDVVLIDTPASDEFADAEIIASRAGAALVLTRQHQTSLPALQRMASRLQDSGVALVGTVLNAP